MIAKPTPGPYTIRSDLSGMTRVFCSTGFSIAQFPHLYHDGGSEQAEANARAFVEGMAAMDRLERIERWIKADAFAGEKLVRIRDILEEAKP